VCIPFHFVLVFRIAHIAYDRPNSQLHSLNHTNANATGQRPPSPSHASSVKSSRWEI
jgi:hypothetical protein